MGLMDMLKTSDPMAKFYAAAEKSNVPQGGITGKLFSSMFPHGLGNLAFGREPEPMPPLETPEGTALMADLASNMMVPGTFIGPKGLARLFGDDAAKGMLATAESKLAQGVPKEAVFQELGVFKGPEGRWRYEIDDSGTFYRGAKASGKSYANAADVLPHDELYNAYPALGNAGIYESMTGKEPSGSYNHIKNTIALDGMDKWSTTLHELQHGVQHLEDFARGGNPYESMNPMSIPEYAALKKQFDMLHASSSGWTQELGAKYKAINEKMKEIEEINGLNLHPFDRYQRLAGEAESRDVQARIGMPMAQRRSTFPSYASRDDLIVRGLMSGSD